MASEGAQEIERCGIGPLQIVEQDRQRALDCARGEGRARLGEGRLPPGDDHPVAIGADECRWQGGMREEGGESGERLAPGAVGRGLDEIVAATDQHGPDCRHLAEQLLRQRGLANPGLATDHDQAAAPCHGVAPMRTEEIALALAPGEREPYRHHRFHHIRYGVIMNVAGPCPRQPWPKGATSAHFRAAFIRPGAPVAPVALSLDGRGAE
jgi:hypothetical protein